MTGTCQKVPNHFLTRDPLLWTPRVEPCELSVAQLICRVLMFPTPALLHVLHIVMSGGDQTCSCAADCRRVKPVVAKTFMFSVPQLVGIQTQDVGSVPRQVVSSVVEHASDCKGQPSKQVHHNVTMCLRIMTRIAEETPLM